MTTPLLGKGQNIGLSADCLRVQLTTSPRGGLDTSALLLASTGRIRHDPDFVFYNQPVHPSGAVRRVERGDEDAIELSLSQLEADVERVIITCSVDVGTISRYNRATVSVVDSATGGHLCAMEVAAEGSETAVVLAEVYRRDGRWKLRSVSQGYDSGLAGLASDYGIHVESTPPSATAAPAPTAPPAPTASPAPVPAPAPAGPPPISDEERERVRAAFRSYGQACDQVLTLCNQVREVASMAMRAREMTLVRPQHEISIHNFTIMAEEKEQEFAGLRSAFDAATRRARDAGSRIVDLAENSAHPFEPDITLMLVLDGTELMGAAATAAHILRGEFGADPASFDTTFERVKAAVEADDKTPLDPDFAGYVVAGQRVTAPAYGDL